MEIVLMIARLAASTVYSKDNRVVFNALMRLSRTARAALLTVVDSARGGASRHTDGATRERVCRVLPLRP